MIYQNIESKMTEKMGYWFLIKYNYNPEAKQNFSKK